MPLDRSITITDQMAGRNPWDLTQDDGPGFLGLAGAAVRQGNEIGSYLSSNVNKLTEAEFDKVQDGFSAFSPERRKQIPDGYEDRFYDVSNDLQFQAVKADIEREIKDRRDIEASGLLGFGLEMAAGWASPTTFLPGGALVRGGRAGYSVMRSAASVGLAAAGGTALQEGALYQTQQTRTGMEVATSIGGSAVLGGLIGSVGARLLSKAEFDAISKKLESDLIEDTLSPVEVADALTVRAQSAGASAVDKVNPEDLAVAGPGVAKALAKATAAVKLNPGLEALHSPSSAVRRTFLRMAENTVQTEGEAAGRTLGPAAETVIEQYRNRQAKFIRDLDDIYKRAVKKGVNLPRDEFNKSVTTAARNGDIDPFGNPFVTEAARKLRSDVFEPLKNEAIRVGLLPENVSVNTALSYVYRIWNAKRVIADAPEFKRIVGDHIRKEIANAVAEGKGVDFVSKADMEEYVSETVENIFNNITGISRSDAPDWIVPAKRGPLKERVFNIPDAVVEKFLENDVEAVSEMYVRKMAPDVELTRAFGHADMRDALKEIKDDYADLIKAAKTPEERTKLSDQLKRDVKIIEAFRDLLRNNYLPEAASSDFGHFTRMALGWNYVRLLGGQLLGSLPDFALVLTKRGIASFMADAMPALTSSTKAARIAKSDAKDFFTIAETVHGARQASLADLTNPYAHGRAGDRLMDTITSNFSKFSGINWWNSVMTDIVSVHTMNRVAKTLVYAAEDVIVNGQKRGVQVSYAKLSKYRRGYMGQLGISEDIASRAYAQIQKHGAEENGIWGLNLGRWDDPEAQRVVIAAIQKEVHQTVIKPGVADRPLWTRTNLGKLVMQFKSHALASHQRIMLSGLQGETRHLAEYMLLSTSLGMLVAYGKFIEKGDYESADQLTSNPGAWIAEGIDRAGFIPVLMEGSNIAEKWGVPFGIRTGLQALAGDPDRGSENSRYQPRGRFAAIAGPTVGLFEDLATIATEASQGELSKRGANAALGLVPGGTLPGVRTFMQTQVKPALQEAVE